MNGFAIRRLIPLGAVVLGLLVILALSSLPRWNKEALPVTPATNTNGREVANFTDLRQMTSQSETIIYGKVSAVSPGRVAGPEDEVQIQMRDVTVDVVRSLKGDTSPEVTFEELGWVSGTPTSLNGTRWASPGDTLIVFLVTEEFEGSSVTRLASTQGRFFVDPKTDQLQSNYVDSHHESPWVNAVASWSRPQLLDAVADEVR